MEFIADILRPSLLLFVNFSTGFNVKMQFSGDFKQCKM